MEAHHVSLFLCCIFAVASLSNSQGPVFVNPNNAAAAAIQPTTATAQGSYVTQTVYGFLDFTTTIGNTVMVFSPQSAAPLEPPKPPKDISSNTIIDTKPVIQQHKEVEIKPSKTQVLIDNTPSEKVSSVIQVKSNAPPPAISTKIEVKSAPITKVNIVEGKSSNTALKQAIASKVQIVEAPVSHKPTPPKQNIITKVEVLTSPTNLVKADHQIVASKVEVHSNSKQVEQPVASKVVHIKSDEEPAVIIGNNIGEPEYDFLSRQPSEVVEETYKVINLKPSSKFILKHRPTEVKKNAATKRNGGSGHPTGLVTKLGGTVVKDGVTTVIETSVIGTYISGKYAQVLQSSSRKINPTQSLRILKTASPALGKGNKQQQQQQQHQRHIEPSPVGTINEETSLGAFDVAQNTIKSTRKPSSGGKRFKNRHKAEQEEDNNEAEVVTQPSYKKSKSRGQTQTSRTGKHNTSSTHKRNRNRKTTTTKPSVHSEETTTAAPSVKRFSVNRRNKQNRPSSAGTESTTSGYSRRGFKPKVVPSTVEATSSSSSLYKFKLNRSPGRWQYKTTSKPRVTIRKQNSDEPGGAANNETTSAPTAEVSGGLNNDVVTPQARSDDIDGLEGSESIASIIDDESSTENKLDAPAFPIETIKVEISTPPDFTDVYYEIATIKTPYTFQAGGVKNTRYVTVTSTIEKSLEASQDILPSKVAEPLTENILATSSNYVKDNNFLDTSIATLPALYLASDMETPPLETFTETFSTTQTMLKTHILPVVRHPNDTVTSTLVQTYVITRLVTATKTLPPMDAYQFIPSKTLNEFNSHLDEAGSELHLELEFGDNNEQDDGIRKVSLPPDLDLANIGSKFDLSDVDRSKLMEAHLRPKKAQSPPKPSINDLPPQGLSPDQLQQLALYRLLNAGAGQGQVITTSKPVLKIETLYETFVLPVTQGHNTIQSTISKFKGTITKTDYEFGTSTIAATLPQIPQIPQLQQIPQIPQLPPQIPQLNPFLPQPQQQFAVTSSPIIQSTMVTQTNSKVLKLTFGAKTAHTTVFSTTVIPTLVTSYITASVAVGPTAAAYPNYFPPPYAGYPFVG